MTTVDLKPVAGPSFPPLLEGRQAHGTDGPFSQAIAGAGDRSLGAGDLIWSFEGNRMSVAIVLEPEVKRARCHEILFVLMVAFGDAFGTLSPPDIKITHDWPNVILVNDGETGRVMIELSNQERDGSPDWMVAGLSICMAPGEDDPEPGVNLHRTTLWEEGCGGIDITGLLEATARHFLVWVHAWEEDGFKPVHQAWSERMAERALLTLEYEGRSVTGQPLGLDENGGLLLRSGEDTRALSVSAMPGLSR